jgi:hypothetical protein
MKPGHFIWKKNRIAEENLPSYKERRTTVSERQRARACDAGTAKKISTCGPDEPKPNTN